MQVAFTDIHIVEEFNNNVRAIVIFRHSMESSCLEDMVRTGRTCDEVRGSPILVHFIYSADNRFSVI